MSRKYRVGVVGAGQISGIYLDNMISKFSNLEVAGITANHYDHARARADQYGIHAYESTDAMLKDPSIDMIVVLTPTYAHYDIIKKALLSGKHVYTEKTMTETLAQAKELVTLADEKGLYLGSAPDTFLGSALQTARKALDDGILGEVESFSIAITRNNDFLLNVAPFLRTPGAGALQDYLVYYMTALVSILGPVAETAAFVKTLYPQRFVEGELAEKMRFRDLGKIIDNPNESVVQAILTLQNGVAGTISQNHETVLTDIADFVIYGRKGLLYLCDANGFGGDVKFLPADAQSTAEAVTLAPVGAYSGNSRGIGPAEMAEAITEGRVNRASKEMAYHVLDVLDKIAESGRTHRFTKVESSCERPAPFTEEIG